MTNEFSVAFAPFLPWWAIAALAAAGLVLLGVTLMARAPGLWLRALAIAGLVAALANPIVVIEERRGLPDIGVVVVDESKSQGIGSRPVFRKWTTTATTSPSSAESRLISRLATSDWAQ